MTNGNAGRSGTEIESYGVNAMQKTSGEVLTLHEREVRNFVNEPEVALTICKEYYLEYLQE